MDCAFIYCYEFTGPRFKFDAFPKVFLDDIMHRNDVITDNRLLN